MNPRGCAGFPLTTPRLFSAADSDDISTAVQFINQARSGTTLVGVGWGYGANMLTKYLAEIGECSPLTAATCIDNPFDLVEATKYSPNQMAIDQQLTDGLIDILRSNKELFQGKAKGFDVEQALLAKSVREFEKAISMVSHGFDAIEDFYSKSSTRGVVGNVKIPVLFIQRDDQLAAPFAIPRSLIAENPFTSLLQCSCFPSHVIDGCRSALSWCQRLTIEWLTAVELGLLKGRHPLLNDVDIPYEPSIELAHEERVAATNLWLKSKKDSSNGYTMSQSDSLNGYTTEYTQKMFGETDTAASFWLESKKNSLRKSEAEHTGLPDVENGGLDQTHSDDPGLVNEEVSPADGERGQVLQTAQVVMNMLDVTMPNILTEEKKKKVLAAVVRGDTILQASQDAVPEDVSEKCCSNP